jgi:anti-sigma regulatory factor (Ser/Thr protein kinase)
MSLWLRSAGADDVEIYEILLACGEACVNTIAHAHPAVSDAPFEVRATREGADIVIVVGDTGKWRLPPSEGRGRGLALIRELMDTVRVDPGDRGTNVTMRRRLEHASAT